MTPYECTTLANRLRDSWDVAIHTQPNGSLSDHVYHLSDVEKELLISALRFCASPADFGKGAATSQMAVCKHCDAPDLCEFANRCRHQVLK